MVQVTAVWAVMTLAGVDTSIILWFAIDGTGTVIIAMLLPVLFTFLILPLSGYKNTSAELNV